MQSDNKGLLMTSHTRCFGVPCFLLMLALLSGCNNEPEVEEDVTDVNQNPKCLIGPPASICSEQSFKQWLALPVNQRPAMQEQGFASESLHSDSFDALAELLLKDKTSRQMELFGSQWRARKLEWDGYSMPFFFQQFGVAEEGKRSLFISMHGGGGAPAEVNDGQYDNQKHLYDSTMRRLEGVYLAPRAAVDASDMWYKDHIDEFFNLIIQLAVIYEGVDPNRVYLMGYSAGGDGVYQLAPRMADRWAAVAMMAGHPNSASPYSLANTPFAGHVGGQDTAYDRNLRAEEWGQQLNTLEQQYPGMYQHSVKVHEAFGHWMELEDSVALPWMHGFTREPYPKRVHWQQTTQGRSHFYWLSIPVEKLKDKRPVTVEYDVASNSVHIHDNYSDEMSIWLNDTMLDLDKTVTVLYQGATIFEGPVTRRLAHMYESVDRWGDANAVYSVRLDVIKNESVLLR